MQKNRRKMIAIAVSLEADVVKTVPVFNYKKV